MIKIAVTGGIACGKSTVGAVFQDYGVAVSDADDLAHAAMSKGSDVFLRVVDAFGDAALGDDGEIDRAALGMCVFGCDRKRERLNAIVHPAVRAAWTAWLEEQDAADMAAVLIPLLFEGGFQDGWDAIVCVWAPEAQQVARLIDRDLTEAQARDRIRSQMRLHDKVRMSDYVLINAGSRGLLRSQVAALMQSLTTR